MYQHHNWQGALLDYPVSKVVCVGSNYAKHIQEMGSAIPEEPVLFIKPETALCDIRQPLVLPQGLGSVHHEVELAVLIGATLRQATEEHVQKAIAGYGVALDLTLRDVQGKMKKAGQPWEKAKGFEGLFGDLVRKIEVIKVENILYMLKLLPWDFDICPLFGGAVRSIHSISSKKNEALQ